MPSEPITKWIDRLENVRPWIFEFLPWFEIYRSAHDWIGAAEGGPVKHPDGVEVQRFQHATLYRLSTGRIFEVHGYIRQHYDSLGGRNSWLGLPQSDEIDFEGGRASAFQNGAIYWWPDTGAIDINQVAVYYTGLMCYDETYDGVDFEGHDEPYAIASAISPAGVRTYSSQVHWKTDAGEGRPEWGAEIYRGPPAGLVLSVVLMEHDQGDPNKHKEMVAGALGGVAGGLGIATGFIPVIGPIVAPIAGTALAAAARELVPAVNNWLGTGDDRIGQDAITLSAKQLILLARKTPETTIMGVSFRLRTKAMTGHDSRYEAALNAWPQ
ncbi:LGFP repeat-containing protein [Nocardia takedensis]|uniref:LGFP repeat-containing protein n=1 Tax=Nocardia takedensis TaxID=259390 RepID=UPI003F76AADC